MQNYCVKLLACNKQARILFSEQTDLVRNICGAPDLSALHQTLLARTIGCASLLTGLLKDRQRLGIRVKASRRDYSIYADVDAAGNVRGFLSDELLSAPASQINSCSVEQLIGGRGCIQVTNAVGNKHLFTGITDMPYGNIVDDLSHYFAQSEQTPTWLSSCLLFNDNEIVLSRGILVQLLPGSPLSLLHEIKELIRRHEPLFFDSSNKEAMRHSPQVVFDDADLLDVAQLQHYCECSRELFRPMLYSLSKEELASACHNGHAVEMACNLCGGKYSFPPEELAHLI